MFGTYDNILLPHLQQIQQPPMVYIGALQRIERDFEHHFPHPPHRKGHSTHKVSVKK